MDQPVHAPARRSGQSPPSRRAEPPADAHAHPTCAPNPAPGSKPITAVWPGNPYPRGANFDGEGVNFSLFSQHAEKVELCVFDASRPPRAAADRAARNAPTTSGTATSPKRARACSTATACTAPTTPERGHRFNPHKLLIEPYAKHIAGPAQVERRALRLSRRHTRRRICRSTSDDSAAGMPKCRVIDPAFTWGDDRPPRVPWHDTVIYELHVRGFTMRHPGRAADAARHLRGPRDRAGDRSPAAPRRHRRRADAGPRLRGRPAPARTRPEELLGLQHHRLLRARHALLRHRPHQRVQDDGEDAALRGHRGDPRRGLQPHGRRQPDGPDAVVPRRRQRLVLPARAGQPALLHGLHRLRQHAEHAAPARARS